MPARPRIGTIVVAALGLVALFGLFYLLYLDSRSHSRLVEELGYRAPTSDPSLREVGVRQMSTGQTLYVPVYSHIYHDGGKPLLLETTLSVRNIDPAHSIVVRSIRYYSTEGRLIRELLDGPLSVGPLVTAEYLIPQSETSGGSGANFILEWDSEDEALAPVVEAIMVGDEQRGAIGFTTRAYVIDQVPKRNPSESAAVGD